jgi:HprK-related kinase A
VRTDVVTTARALRTLYADFPAHPMPFHDVDARQLVSPGPRRWIRPNARFVNDGRRPFTPVRIDIAYPHLEWAINWCIATQTRQVLLLHAGALALGNRAVLLPASPGSGKSTLTAALMAAGLRLLSDEFGIIDLVRHFALPFPRPVALKNESIGIIRNRGGVTLGPSFVGTPKGTVAHVAPTPASVAARAEPAQVAAIVFPTFRAGAPLTRAPVTRARQGFEALRHLVSAVPSIALVFGDLDEAIDCIRDVLSARQ